ncbi:MAG: hypothetical protein Q8P31_05700 [Bacillota bacterium]|nr:hypothetical protein [Bacillota bacterium]
MIIDFTGEGDRVKFVVREYGSEYGPVLRGLFYAKEGESYTKAFPTDVRNLERVKANYVARAEEMFAQVCGFKPTPWEDALLDIARRLDGAEVWWWLTGSCAACVRGALLSPHDVDVMLDAQDVDRVSDLLADVIIEPIIDTRGWVTSHFGVAFPGARVDLAFDPQDALDRPEPGDSGPYARAHLEEVDWRGHRIKVPPLELQIANNRRRGRMDRVAEMERVLAGRL